MLGACIDTFMYIHKRAISDPSSNLTWTAMRDPEFAEMIFTMGCNMAYQDTGIYLHMLSVEEQEKYFKRTGILSLFGAISLLNNLTRN